MKITFDPNRPQTEEDRAALALIGEGYRRLRAQQVSNAGTGAPGSGDANPPLHASDPVDGSTQGIASETETIIRDQLVHRG